MNIQFPLTSIRVSNPVLKNVSIIINESDVENFPSFRVFLLKSFQSYSIKVKTNILETIQEYSTIIAGCTRRGFANKIMVSPNSDIDLSNIVGYTITFNNELFNNELFLYYDNSNDSLFDGAFILESKLDGTIDAIVNKENTNVMGCSPDYGIVLTIL